MIMGGFDANNMHLIPTALFTNKINGPFLLHCIFYDVGNFLNNMTHLNKVHNGGISQSGHWI